MDLLKEFPPHTPKQWKEQIEKDLKGLRFDELISAAPNGYSIKPFYTKEDLGSEPPPLFSEPGWDCCAHIAVKDEKSANEAALRALNGGASGLSFHVYKPIDTARLLENISLEHIYCQFMLSNDSLHLLEDLKDTYGKVNAYDKKLKCFVNIDPLHLLARFGEWHENEKKDLSVLKRLHHVPVNFSLYHEAGASTVNELATGLCHLNEYFNYLAANNSLKNRSLHLQLSVNSDFFGEIAKLRALRKLLPLLQEQYSVELPVHIHCETTRRDKSALDSYNNMLRTTTEAMSAVIGGCSSLSVLPFNDGFEAVSPFAQRMALNQQHILREESYLGKVADIGAGSYYIESLTAQLAENAWERFKELEAEGGFIACIKSGLIQDLLEKDAANFNKDVQEGRIVLVGVNKFQNPKEALKHEKKIAAGNGPQPPFKPVKLFRMAADIESKIQSDKK